jgi:hypothetical protein
MRLVVREWALRLGLMSASLMVALIILEVIVRLFFPLYGGKDNVTLDGSPIKSFVEPGTVYRQITNEYDALTTITDKGYRAPRVDGNPDVLFVGDSFTFGYGLTDDETFPSLYCKQRHLQCANLGLPGSGTSRQVKRLQEFLDTWQWRPRTVKLFFFGMSRSFSAGNDFLDNYNYGRWIDGQAARGLAAAGPQILPPARVPESPERGMGERIISWQSALLEHVQLVRRAKYHWGPLLRSMVLAEPGEKRREQALMYTARGFKELDDLSRRVGFEYEVYLIVPAHDIIMGTAGDTLALLNGVSLKPAVPTAPLFSDSPASYYFSYDGHLNANGSRRIAQFLISRDSGKAAVPGH